LLLSDEWRSWDSMERGVTKSNIRGAIRRSRASRKRMRAQRRRMLALAASALLSVPVAVTLSLVGLPDQDMLQAAVARAADLADMLAQRSPGDRTQGQLTKTKRLHEAQVAPKFHPRVPLPAGRPIVPVAPALVDLIAPPPDLAPAGILPTIAAGAPSLAAILGSSPGTSSVAPPGGEGTQSNPSLPREPLVTTPAAVPEPGTWAMMLVGFTMIAWRTRRSRACRKPIVVA
jgi:hypothetical protein